MPQTLIVAGVAVIKQSHGNGIRLLNEVIRGGRTAYTKAAPMPGGSVRSRLKRPLIRRRPSADSRDADADGFGAFAAFGDVDDDALALVEAYQAGALQGGSVHEHVLAAAVAHDEAEPLGGIVPLDRAALLHARPGRRLGAEAAAGARRPRRRRRRVIDVQHLGHLRPALSRRHPHLEGLARLHRLDADPAQDARMQERVARAVLQFDEAEAALGLEPLDDRLDRRPRRLLEAGAAEPRRRPEIARRRLEIVIAKTPPAPLPKPSVPFHRSRPDPASGAGPSRRLDRDSPGLKAARQRPSHAAP